jgi:hypothetical protein
MRRIRRRIAATQDQWQRLRLLGENEVVACLPRFLLRLSLGGMRFGLKSSALSKRRKCRNIRGGAGSGKMFQLCCSHR